MFYPIRIGVSWVVTSTLISSKMAESQFPMLMLQCSLPRAVMLPLIPFMWTSEWVTCFWTSFCSREIGTMQVEHPKSNIATPENVMPLAVKVALPSVDQCKESFWRLNMWWLGWKNRGRAITFRHVRTENLVPRCLWMVYPDPLQRHGPE